MEQFAGSSAPSVAFQREASLQVDAGRPRLTAATARLRRPLSSACPGMAWPRSSTARGTQGASSTLTRHRRENDHPAQCHVPSHEPPKQFVLGGGPSPWCHSAPQAEIRNGSTCASHLPPCPSSHSRGGDTSWVSTCPGARRLGSSSSPSAFRLKASNRVPLGLSFLICKKRPLERPPGA